jgi:endonuclease/exonuclease/phosphatase (EEP) superfamily protein YafD
VTETGQTAAHLKPLVIGRLTRVIFGLLTLYWSTRAWHNNVPAIAVSLALFFLGLSFLVGGIIANPGCEITALVNLLLPKPKRVHCQ